MGDYTYFAETYYMLTTFFYEVITLFSLTFFYTGLSSGNTSTIAEDGILFIILYIASCVYSIFLYFLFAKNDMFVK